VKDALLLVDALNDFEHLAGAATEGCVAQTAIDARELGFKVTVLAGACATVDERIEQVTLNYLENVVGARIERSS
jgi:nicotinamidase-related amidase